MTPGEIHIRETIRDTGALGAYRQLVAENDALVLSPDIDNGRAIAAARTAIHTAIVELWAAEQVRAFGYDKPFAVAALGGTGRAEMTPCSDNDFAFLFDEALEDNAFLLELQRQTLHTREFAERNGFVLQALPFCLDDVPELEGKQLNAFLDMRPVHDPGGLTDEFRERIRATRDLFEHFLHVRGFWKDRWEKAAGESERIDVFDIKNDGLRIFLAAIWTRGGKEFLHSHEVYRTLPDRRDIEAYDFLLRIRAFVHLRRARAGAARGAAGGNHAEDVLRFEDFVSFGEMLGGAAGEAEQFEFSNLVRGRLLSARRRVAHFAKGVIEAELRDGRRVAPGSPMVFGAGGLRRVGGEQPVSAGEKSRAALSLVQASQRYGVPIDPSELDTTFRNAGDWLIRVPELSALFYEPRGSLADSFEFLSQIDGAMERLFPGYAKFESSMDARVMIERKSLRGALERQKMRALESYVREGRAQLDATLARGGGAGAGGEVVVGVEAGMLDPDHLAGVKLALKTKRLPVTADDAAMRENPGMALHERYSSGFSGIPLAEYFPPFRSECDLSEETVRTAAFLVANRRAFKARALAAMNDAQAVADFAGLCGSEQMLRSLFVFTCADRVDWESERTDPARWFNTRELYSKAMQVFRPGPDPLHSLTAAGFSRDQLEILRDFGVDFFGGVYRRYAPRFGGHLARMVEEPDSPGSKAAILREGASTIVGVAARDYRGLAATISGALWNRGIDLQQAHLFSSTHHGLALDFFHLAPREKAVPADLSGFIEEAIREQRYIADADDACLPQVKGSVALSEWRPGQFCVRFETAEQGSGIVYALAYKVFRHLRGNIFGLMAHGVRGSVYVSVYLSLPADLSCDEAEAVVKRHF